MSLTVETPLFGAVEFGCIWEACNPFQIRATHRAAPYVRLCVLKYLSWGTWALAMLLPGLVAMFLMPLVLYFVYPPEIKEPPPTRRSLPKTA